MRVRLSDYFRGKDLWEQTAVVHPQSVKHKVQYSRNNQKTFFQTEKKTPECRLGVAGLIPA